MVIGNCPASLNTPIRESRTFPGFGAILPQAEKIRGYSKSGELTKALLTEMLTEEKPKPRKVTIKGERLSKYFPEDMSAEEIEDKIIRILEEWKDKGGQ